ncbi:MAG: histone family protein [Nanobdellota archaeon]
MARDNVLPYAAFGKVLENAGAERVSKESMEELNKIMTSYAHEVSKKAVKLARHSGRKTVKAKDIRLAVE